MARIRSIHPDACDNEKLAALSHGAERTLWRLITHADDDGRGIDNPKLLAAKLFPLVDDVDADTLDAFLDELVVAGVLERYRVGDKGYFEVHDFGDWQKPKRKVDSKHPAPSEGVPRKAVTGGEHVGNIEPPELEGSGGDVGGETEGESEGEQPPSSRKRSDRATRLPEDWRPDPEPELVKALGGQPAAKAEWDKFCDYWRAQPGQKGRKVDWQATWRNWLRRAAEDAPRNGRGKSPVRSIGTGGVADDT